MTHYPLAATGGMSDTGPHVSLPVLERAVLAYWDKDHTFQASIDQRPAGVDGSNEFVFYDGPPFANGLPHYGHLLTGYAKDLIARYQSQRGRRVERRFGWDTHGLPAELEAMKQLGLKEKNEIVALGIDAFNEAARNAVLAYTQQWRDYVHRQGRWVDIDNDYKTLETSYMESVMWAFKELHKRGLTYQGFRVLPYCWRDETPLSNHELRMDDDVYQRRQDPSVTVSFPISASDHPLRAQLCGVGLLAWTTTPWTLPTNLALAVGPDIDYACVSTPATSSWGGRRFLIAAPNLPAYAKVLGFASEQEASSAVTGVYRGSELAGLRYEPLWRYYTDTEQWGTGNAWQVLADEYVSVGDGTGIVHQAPAYGEDDQRSCEAHGIPAIVSIDDAGRFLPLFAEAPQGSGQAPLAQIAGLQVFDANPLIVRVLRGTGRLIRESSYEHAYPHCWRCRKPLIYKTVASWYVRVMALKERMAELNQEITWIPSQVKNGQFGAWLANARDWSISRNRFWGNPIPVWVSDDPQYPRVDVYGSLAELEKDFGRLPCNADGEVDLHRPYIDELTRPNPDDPTGAATMRRVEDVLDVWFDSGSMPFAHVHYPFENDEWFRHHHPADFIVEYVGQTRGWFYMLHVLATALFDRPAFRNVISHGIILGSDKQKLSKSLRNYPDVNRVFERDGSEAMRWFLMSSPLLRGGNLVIDETSIRDIVRQVLLPLWNAYSFFVLYANASAGGAGYQARWRTDGYEDVMDRYLMGQTTELVREVQAALDAYDISLACQRARAYLEMLTNWYIRRSRHRFFDEEADAFDALYTALEVFCRVGAPMLPFLTESIWRGLTGERSVHLSDWPQAQQWPEDAELIEAMGVVSHICSAGSSLRKGANVRVRVPLESLTVLLPQPQQVRPFVGIIADELNIKQVRLEPLTPETAQNWGVQQQYVLNFRQAGKRLGAQVQKVAAALRAQEAVEVTAEGIRVAGVDLVEGEYEQRLVSSAEHGVLAQLPHGGFAILNTHVSAELAAEGVARDLVRTIQQARKDAGLQVGDRIATTVRADEETIAAACAHGDLLKAETLSLSLELIPSSGPLAVQVQRLG